MSEANSSLPPCSAVAAACGWERASRPAISRMGNPFREWGFSTGKSFIADGDELDLNAMHAAEEWLMSQLTLEQWNEHVARLVKICGEHNPSPKYRIQTVGDHFCYAIHANEKEREKAFLQSLQIIRQNSIAMRTNLTDEKEAPQA